MADEESARHIGGVQERATAWRGFCQFAGAWHLQGFSMFSVLSKSDGRWIGRVGPWMPEGWPGTEIGWGISVTGKYIFGNKDDIRFGVNAGGGLGRYIGLNTANGAILDANGNLETIDSVGLFGSWRHLWNQKWRSNFIYSRLDIDNNTSLSGTGVTSATWSGRANLMFDWAKNLTLGGELALANRELESGADGDLTRLQFMAMYKF